MQLLWVPPFSGCIPGAEFVSNLSFSLSQIIRRDTSLRSLRSSGKSIGCLALQAIPGFAVEANLLAAPESCERTPWRRGKGKSFPARFHQGNDSSKKSRIAVKGLRPCGVRQGLLSEGVLVRVTDY
jgi:hypothetical protein